MRIYPGTTVDYEFKQLGDLGYTGTLNDRQFAALRAEGLTGSLPDMFKQFDGTLGGGGPSLSDQVEAALAGKAGIYLDPIDLTGKWQDSGKTTPVVAPTNPVYVFTSKYGATQYEFTALTDAGRPAFDTNSLIYDGADDRLLLQGVSFGQNVPALAMVSYVKPTILKIQSVGQVSTNNAGINRLYPGLNADGSVRTVSRRLDADADTTVTSAAGLISAGTAYVITSIVDFAIAGAMSMRINGAEVASGTLPGSPGNTSNTQANRTTLGAVSAANFLNGRLGRTIICGFLPTPSEIALFEALVSEVAL